MKTWTVAFVNYKTSVYLKWQLKILYEFNNPEDFDIIIVDNSRPFEKKELESLAYEYNKIYDNIKIVYYTPKGKIDSEQHGEGMTVALKMANTKYFLAEDPDFFFVIKNHLDFLAKHLDKGLVGIGAPYINSSIGLGNPKFPALWGAAHPLDLIKDLDCLPDYSEKTINEAKIKYKDYKNYTFDTGYKIREKLSTSDRDDNFISFTEKDVKYLAEKIGIHSYEVVTKSYSYEDKEIAYHLFRGSFTGQAKNGQDLNKKLSKKKIKIRNNFGKYFYEYVKNGEPPKTPIRLANIFKFIYKKERDGKKRNVTLFNIIKFTYSHK